MSASTNNNYTLPSSLIGRSELASLAIEAEELGESLQAAKVRSDGSDSDVARASAGLLQFAEQNKLDLNSVEQLHQIKKQLQSIIKHAPSVHLTFASEVDQKTLEKLVEWFRSEAHSHTIVTVGLQPSLVGGVYLRTPNQVHDFSFRSFLNGKRDILLKELGVARES